ncbi:type IV secretion system protein [Salmonella enterica]|uniref:type IV secretion system protein n=1 Tax=Salmonella enterica TaxID=28901 RepID=UPI003BD02DEA
MATSNSAVYQNVFEYINNVCHGYIGTSVSNVASAIGPAAYNLLGIYIILWGLSSALGLIKEPIMDAMIRIAKVSIIFGIAINLMSYNAYVTDVFYNTPEQLANALRGNTESTTTINMLDQILVGGYDVGKKFWDKGGILDGDFGMYIIAILVWAETILVTLYGCFLTVLSKIALSIIISIGPVFILTLLFQATGNFFNSWIQQLSNYFLLQVLVAAAGIFVLDFYVRASSTTAAITDATQIDQLFPFIITGGICLLVLAQLPSVAAGLAGGISLSSYGVGRMGLAVFSRNSRAAFNRLGDGAKTGGEKVWGAARERYRRRRNHLSPS